MKSLGLISAAPPPQIRSSPFLSLSRTSSNRITLKIPAKRCGSFVAMYLNSNSEKSSSSEGSSNSKGGIILSRGSISVLEDQSINSFKMQQLGSSISHPHSINPLAKMMSTSDQAFVLLAFIACTTSVAFTSFVITAVPTLLVYDCFPDLYSGLTQLSMAIGRAASSFAKLADTARQELPSTLAAIRLSGMEISDLTLELSDLSQEITDGVNKSAKAVQAAEAGIRQIGTLAHQQTLSMIDERASLPEISLQPVVAGAAKKTSHAIGRASKTLMSIITRGDKDEDV